MGRNKFAIYADTKDHFFLRERGLTFTFTSAPAMQKLVVREKGNIAEELVKQ